MLVLYKKVNKLQITSAGKFEVVLAFRNLKLYPALIYRHHPLVGILIRRVDLLPHNVRLLYNSDIFSPGRILASRKKHRGVC